MEGVEGRRVEERCPGSGESGYLDVGGGEGGAGQGWRWCGRRPRWGRECMEARGRQASGVEDEDELWHANMVRSGSKLRETACGGVKASGIQSQQGLHYELALRLPWGKGRG